MEKHNRLMELFHRLQDPHLVSRFQQMCGVRGTFSRTSSSGSGDEADRTHSHNNGACRHHISGEREAEKERRDGEKERGDGEKERRDGEKERGDGEKERRDGEKERALRRRTTRKNSAEEGTHAPHNGAVLPTASAGGEALGAGSSGRRFAGSSAEGEDVSGGTEPEEGGEAAASPRSSTLKPLRKNSLTGDDGQEFLIENRFLYYLFTFGTELGNEFFYITFFPSIIWNVDAFVGRRLIMVWVWVMYLGQCTKDVLRWSRPASPPVVKVEMFYNSEYSMPSTHAMSGTAIPFALFFMTYGRWQFPFPLGFSLALSWCLLVCVSRIYMGMHSVLDVIAGVLYSSLILLLFLPALDLIDGFNLTCRYAPLVIISLHLGLGLFSFTLDTWSTSRGDTAQILGTGAGIALASHVNHYLGVMPDQTAEQLPLISPGLSWGLVGMVLLRVVLGVLVLVATRAVMKALTIPLVCWVSGVPGGDVRKARQHMEVELPYRYIVYGSVGFNVLFLVPLLFRQMQLS